LLLILIYMNRGSFFVTPFDENPVAVFGILFLLFFLVKLFNLVISDRITLNFGFIFIAVGVFLFGPLTVIPLLAAGVAADLKKKEKLWVVVLNAGGDMLRVIPGIFIFRALGGWFAFSGISLKIISPVLGYLLWFMACDFALVYLFTLAKEGKSKRQFSQYLTPYLIDLSFFPLSLLAVVVYVRLGVPYVLLILIPFGVAFYVYRYATGKKKENIELKQLNEKLKRLGREKSFLYEKAKNFSEKLKKVHYRLLQSEKLASIGKLAAGVAHELNTPLGAIMINSEFALSFADDEDVKESLDTIKNATLKCKNITEKLLLFSRKEDIKIATFQVLGIVDEAIRLLTHRLKDGQIVIEKKLEEDLQITGRAEEFSSVLVNLIQNSIDAIEDSQTEKGVITVMARREKENVIISVKDNGPGMEKSVVDRIFDPFFTTRDVGKGTGLGLWLCMNIMTRHRGKILVKSSPGEGSEFVAVVPIGNEEYRI